MLLLAFVSLLFGCTPKHDCNKSGHEWITGAAGKERCKHCEKYKSQDEDGNAEKDKK
jgi:hypothetical protein